MISASAPPTIVTDLQQQREMLIINRGVTLSHKETKCVLNKIIKLWRATADTKQCECLTMLISCLTYQDIVESSLFKADETKRLSVGPSLPCCLHLSPNRLQIFMSIRSTISSSSDGCKTESDAYTSRLLL